MPHPRRQEVARAPFAAARQQRGRCAGLNRQPWRVPAILVAALLVLGPWNSPGRTASTHAPHAPGRTDDAHPAQALRGAVAGFRDDTLVRLPASVRTGTASTMDVEPADLDGDGDLDLVLAVEFGVDRILDNDGTGVFVDVTSERLPDRGGDSEDIAVADLDGDGDLDLVFAHEDDRVDTLYLNDGAGSFLAASERLGPPASARASNAVLALDVDGDGLLDLLFGDAGPNRLLLARQDGTWERDDGRIALLPTTTQDLEAGDIDGDGDLDLVEANEDGNRILMAGPDGRYRDETSSRLPAPAALEETREADLGDMDGDGDLDLYLANVDFRGNGPPRDRLLRNDGHGVFEDVSYLLPAAALHTVDVDWLDLDGDERLDLVLTHAFGGGLTMLQGAEDEGFVDRTSALLGDLRMRAANGIDVEYFELEPGGARGLYASHFQSGDLLLVASDEQTASTPTEAATATRSFLPTASATPTRESGPTALRPTSTATPTPGATTTRTPTPVAALIFLPRSERQSSLR